MENAVPAVVTQDRQDRKAGRPTRAAGPAANWDDEEALPHRLSAAEAAKFRDQRRSPSPWRVVLVQAEAGAVIALLAGLLAGLPALWSALYGAATAVLPGTLMARGATRMADSRSPMATALSLLGWESTKIISSVAMLFIGFRTLHLAALPLLATLGACLAVYWVALAWRSH